MASRFCASFSRGLPRDFRFAIEFRHAGWHRPQFIHLLEKNHICWAWADTTPLNERNLAPFEFLPLTTDFLYLRLLGDYATKYDVDGEHVHRYEKLLWKREAAIESWSLKIERHLSEVRNVWAFVSNHFEGFAPETCQRLARRLGFDLRLPSETRKPSQTRKGRNSIFNYREGGAPATPGDTARTSRLCFSKTHTSRIPKTGHLLRQTREIFRELHVRMRVGGSRKWNAFLHRQFDDPVGGVKFVHRLAPSSGRQLNRKVARSNEIERFANDGVDLCVWPMAMDFYEVEMSEAIDQPSRGNFTDTPKIIRVNCIDISAIELPGAGRNAVEHLIRAIKEMDRAQDKIELIPMLLDPFSPSRRA